MENISDRDKYINDEWKAYFIDTRGKSLKDIKLDLFDYVNNKGVSLKNMFVCWRGADPVWTSGSIFGKVDNPEKAYYSVYGCMLHEVYRKVDGFMVMRPIENHPDCAKFWSVGEDSSPVFDMESAYGTIGDIMAEMRCCAKEFCQGGHVGKTLPLEEQIKAAQGLTESKAIEKSREVSLGRE